MTPEMQALCNSLSCITYQGNQHTHILIEENDRQALLKKVTLLAPNGDWFAFAPDKGRGRKAQMSPLLATASVHSHHCACDAVIVVRKNQTLTVIFVDLKSGNPSGYSSQFQSSRQFMRYVLGLLDEFHGFKFAKIEERFVIFWGGKKTLLDKRSTLHSCKNRASHNPKSAQKELVTNGTSLYLKELLA
jgi:hypothetical protein